MATRVETSYGSGARRLGLLTWAEVRALDTASLRAGDNVEVTDLNYGVFVWSGTLWRPRAPVLLDASGVAVVTPNNTTENVLATVTVPAGAMGLNGALQLKTSWSCTTSANAKTIRARLGGAAGTQFITIGVTTSVSVSDERRIRNRNSAALQVGSYGTTSSVGFGTSPGSLPTSALDTLVAQDLVFTGQKALGTETLTLESREVWLLP